MRTNIMRFIRRIVGVEQLLKTQKSILYTVNASYHASRFSQAIQDCSWLKHKGFSFGDFNWAMDALALHNLFRILEDVKPRNIIEFGAGQSSKLVHQYAEYYKVNALTVEHDQDWIDHIKIHAPQINFNIRQVGLEKIKINDKETFSYCNIAQLFCFGSGGNLIIVDGPFGQPHYSRSQILEFVLDIAQRDFCVFMHDSERVGEQETLSLFCEKLNQNGVEYFVKNYFWSYNKQHTVICSKSWKLLITL